MLAAAATRQTDRIGSQQRELANDQTPVTILIFEGDALGDDVEITGQDLC